jgi:energy-coupling factor transport system substrate-specific component
VIPIGARARPLAVYLLTVLVGAGAFLYPFWLPQHTIPDAAHSGDAPLVAGVVGALVVGAMLVELRRGTMNGATVALLGVLAASAGFLRLLELPGGGNGIFFLVVLAGVAFGPRFGLLLGVCSMAVSAVLTGGIGPWLPFQMLALGWMGAGAGVIGLLTQRLDPRIETLAVAAYGWIWAFVYGAIMNLWFWPFTIGQGPLAWHPGLSAGSTVHRYWSFYVATSLGWDAAGALTNAVLLLITGRALLRSMRRFSHRLEPVVSFDDDVVSPAAV